MAVPFLFTFSAVSLFDLRVILCFMARIIASATYREFDLFMAELHGVILTRTVIRSRRLGLVDKDMNEHHKLVILHNYILKIGSKTISQAPRTQYSNILETTMTCPTAYQPGLGRTGRGPRDKAPCSSAPLPLLFPLVYRFPPQFHAQEQTPRS